MSSYQSFPGNPGSSASLEKLARLALPPLASKSFLDIGCNEGFFCGYAFFDAALKVTGVDKSAEALGKARERFPQCEFIEGDFENLDSVLKADEKYDVILCSSALHYASDQPEVVKKLMSRLKKNGTLVLEMGIVTDPSSRSPLGGGWHKVARSIDSRLFPNWEGVRNMLEPYVYKNMGASVMQTGDPVSRFVLHIKNAAPTVFLLAGHPGSGKSTMAKKFFKDIPVLSGDALLYRIPDYKDKFPLLAKFAGEKPDHQRLDRTIYKIFYGGAGDELAALAIAAAGEGDFVYDGFIPEEFQAQFQKALARFGYRVVNIESPGPEIELAELSRRAKQESRKYAMYLAAAEGLRKSGARH